MKALYTDGTPVLEGDRVRYHQTPGGLMSPEANADGTVKWHVGTAVKRGHGSDPDELVCEMDVPTVWARFGHMAPHIIERLEAK